MDRARFSSSEEIFESLLAFVNVEKGQKTEFKLDRMAALCAALGHPEAAYETIHVAGSKGKGSVSAMIARILEASGSKTGLYTSPHLLRWKERISLAGVEMPESILIAAAEEVLPLVDGRTGGDFPGGELPTYFELSTLIAFCAFRLAGCEWVVVETGLGGRLDSTNVVPSRASVITPIELEHTEWLGDSIPKIAFEKAGIMKPGRPCYLSRQRPEALEVFRRASADRGSPLNEAPLLARIAEVSVEARGTRAMVDLSAATGLPPGFGLPLELSTPMVGGIQAENMALAVLAAAGSFAGVSPETARAGLAKARLPARFQVLDLQPQVVVDGAHTPDSCRIALASFELLFPGRKALLFACALDKNHAEMARILASGFETVIVTKPGNFKQSDPGAVLESFRRAGARVRLIEDTGEAVRAARSEALASGLPLLVAGSFYLCAEALMILGV
ncbi:MAG TPA: folylpolyglutamate synthase/dihydrofolate synthase family protein [Rectinemataceae bacterium]|nr:folylpolyglutamate synthase/dihydrofolate synthase family protein [Rectinemataceae bacterium]